MGATWQQRRLFRLWQGFSWQGFVVPLVIIAGIELYFDLSGLKSDSLAAPSAVVVAFIGGVASGEIIEATLQTLATMLGGLAIGGIIGLVMGIARGLFWRVDEVLDLTTEALRPIPSVALIPVAILIFGFGYWLEITCVAFSCAWTVFVLTRAAVTGVEPRLLEVSRVLRLGLWARAFKIVLPAALPRIFVAFRLAASLALIVAVTTEVAANPLGLGSRMEAASQSLHPGLTIAYLVWIGFIGWLLNAMLVLLQRRLWGTAATPEGADA